MVTAVPLVVFCASGLFVASDLQVSDTGQYVCKATNVAGQVDKNFHLNIYGSIISKYRFIHNKENTWRKT